MRYKVADIADVVNVSVKNPSTSGISVFVGLEHYDVDEPVITRYGSTKMLTTAVKKFNKGDILLARRNVYLRRAGKVDFDGVTSGDSIVIRVKNDLSHLEDCDSDLMKRLLPFVLNTNAFWDYANTNSDGTMSKRLSPQMLLDYEFDLPSIEEQKALADKLWAAYRLKESYKKLLAATEEMVKSQFIEMFGNPYDGWKCPVRKLGDVYAVGTGGTPDRKNLDYYHGDIPWVKSTEVNYCELYDTEEHISVKAISESNCSLYSSGTILLAMYGQGITRGRVAILRNKATVNQAIAAIQVTNETESIFLYHLLKVNYDYIRNLAVGGNQHNLNLKLVSSIPIVRPERELQERFVSIAEQADKSGFELRKSIDAIDAVIKSLINS